MRQYCRSTMKRKLTFLKVLCFQIPFHSLFGAMVQTLHISRQECVWIASMQLQAGGMVGLTKNLSITQLAHEITLSSDLISLPRNQCFQYSDWLPTKKTKYNVWNIGFQEIHQIPRNNNHWKASQIMGRMDYS